VNIKKIVNAYILLRTASRYFVLLCTFAQNNQCIGLNETF